MSATLNVAERKEAQENLCISTKTLVTISASPVHDHIKVVNILRPNTFEGKEDDNGNLLEPGTIHLLNRLVLDEFDLSSRNNFENFQKTIIFVKNVDEGILINDELAAKYPYIPIHHRPWVLNHSRKKPVSRAAIAKGCDNGHYKLIITTSTMLMGLNIPKVRRVIMLGPFGMMGDHLQALGRAGRREDGGRAQSIYYNCWNKTDLVHHVSDSVRQFCETDQCLKVFCDRHFGWEGNIHGGAWCCSNCV